MDFDVLIYAFVLIVYYLIFCALIPMYMKSYLKIPDELSRKYQHISYAMSIFIIVGVFDFFYHALIASVILVIIAFPFLYFFEKTSKYQKYLVDRNKKGGEMRQSMLLIQLSYALLITFFWGILGAEFKYVIVVAVMTWGFGDAAAALFGKAFGKTKIKIWFVDHKKTWFGSHAMTIAAGLTLLLMLLFYVGFVWYVALLIAILVAPVSSALELFSKDGNDTLYVPIGTAITLLIWILIFTQIGWI
jgi:phytol kinase